MQLDHKKRRENQTDLTTGLGDAKIEETFKMEEKVIKE